MKKIAALTTVRNGDRFLSRWINYYGAQLGPENLFVIIDGLDQPVPDPALGANIRQVPHVPRSRAAGDKFRAARSSRLAQELFETYDLVLGMDVDEFIAVDPDRAPGLREYLSQAPIEGCASALGIDVARNSRAEGPLDWGRPFLEQRHFGQISDRYTKASILAEPHRWGSGFHRVKGKPFHIDENLYLFHFGSVDDSETQSRSADSERAQAGWQGHQERRNSVQIKVSTANIQDGDAVFAKARALLSKPRSLIAWNKPKPLPQDEIIEIPKRFRSVF